MLFRSLTVHEQGAKAVMLESAHFEARGGNSHYTGGAYRFAHNGIEDLLKISPDISDEERESIDFGTYTEDQYFDDMARMSQYRADPDMIEILVRSSFDAALWMREQGVRFQPSLGRQAFKVDGKFRFWGGLTLQIWGGGAQLVATLHAKAEKAGIPVPYETPAVALDRAAIIGWAFPAWPKRVDPPPMPCSAASCASLAFSSRRLPANIAPMVSRITFLAAVTVEPSRSSRRVSTTNAANWSR